MRKVSRQRLGSVSDGIAGHAAFVSCEAAAGSAKSLFWNILRFKLLGLRILADPGHIGNPQVTESEDFAWTTKKNYAIWISLSLTWVKWLLNHPHV